MSRSPNPNGTDQVQAVTIQMVIKNILYITPVKYREKAHCMGVRIFWKEIK